MESPNVKLTAGSIWQRIVDATSKMSKPELFVLVAANGVVIFLCTKIWYYSEVYNPWRNSKIKWAKRTFWYGSYKDNLKRPLHEVENRRYEKLSKNIMYGYFQGACPFISLCKPHYVSGIRSCASKEVFVTGNEAIDSTLSYFETDRWQRVRNKIGKVLSRENEMFRYAFEDVVEKMYTLVNIIKNDFGNGRPINVKRMFDAFAFDATCNSLLLTEYETIKNPDNDLLKEIRRILDTSDKFASKMILKSHFPKIAEWIKSRSIDKDPTYFKKEVHNIIYEKYWHEKADFYLVKNVLQAMFSFDVNLAGSEIMKTGLRLEDTTHQFFYYVVFGSQKVSTLVTMACYLLARHEDVQNDLRKEIYEAIIRDRGVFPYNSFDDIKYLNLVIKETLRMYPPVTRIERVMEKKLNIKNASGYVPKGAHVTIPICGIHRGPNYENPKRFDPSRFIRNPPPVEKFLPFGMGNRKCIGETFAEMVTKIMLVYIVGSFDIAVCPHTKIPPKFGLGTHAFLSVEDMVLTLTTRRDSPIQMRRL
ncbi:cytochrome P450 3A5 [Trichonephila inaurata madagascariensis]|uniref:Cytochrome P450 3A5 n=1 Tax=Trichonephila inaurata madagascariensis TaxID=2747483 RepID=A0A8X6IDU8_9ARAC|nr:cytochrome P450 3A5 [Trichonephila inaurata madagascariensis]